MRTARCARRPRPRAALTQSRLLTYISSPPNPSAPQKLQHTAARTTLNPRLACILPASRNNSTSHREPPLPAFETKGVDKAARQVIRESTKTSRAGLTPEFYLQYGSSVCSPVTDRKLPLITERYFSPVTDRKLPPATENKRLLLSLFERLVPRGLLPQVTAEPPSSTPAGHEPALWTVTISLPELGIDAEGRGSKLVSAEVDAAVRFDQALRSHEHRAELLSRPQTQLSRLDANNIVQSYWQFAYASHGALKRTTTSLDSGAFEARTLAGSTQIGHSVTSALKDSARGIQDLALAHAITNGHPDLWPTGLENPFQARIVLDHARLESLRQLTTAATDYLRTTPGQLVGGTQRGGVLREVTQQSSGQTTVEFQQGGSADAPNRDIPDLQSWLAALPFPPARAKMLVVGASIRCLEHAILLAAVEKHAVYRETASCGQEDGGPQNSDSFNVTEGDHQGLLLLFQRLRDEKWLAKKQRRLPKPDGGDEEASRLHDNAHCRAEEDVAPGKNDLIGDHEGFQTLLDNVPEPVDTPPREKALIARRFDHYDPKGIDSVSATAREIERSMITAGLASYQKETSYVSVPGSQLRVRAEPYGGKLSRTTYRRNMLRNLLVLGFPENIAQVGYGTIIPGQPPQLRIDSQEVYVDSPLKAPMPQKQLSRNLRAGPLMVVTGMTDNPGGGGLSARYCTPISTWEAVLLGKTLTLPNGKETPAVGAVQVLVNNWLPVLVRSAVEGVSNEEARDTLFEAREALHRAIDKAMYDYIKCSWNSFAFYDLLKDLPSEDRFHTKALPKEKQDAMRNEPRRPLPSKHEPARKDWTI